MRLAGEPHRPGRGHPQLPRAGDRRRPATPARRRSPPGRSTPTAPAVTSTRRRRARSAATSATFDVLLGRRRRELRVRGRRRRLRGLHLPRRHTRPSRTAAHTFHVRATDAAGNTGADATAGWTVDTTAPTTSISERAGRPDASASAIFAFGADEPVSGFECSLDGAAFAACSLARHASTGLADGSHDVPTSARPTSPATSAPPPTTRWTVDTDRADGLGRLAARPTRRTRPPRRSPSRPADGGTSFECARRRAAPTPPARRRRRGTVAAGSHTFHVKATDAAGNPGAAADRALDGRHDRPDDDARPPPRRARRAHDLGELHLLRRRDARPSSARSTAPPSPAAPRRTSLSGLADGSHTFRVRATDTAGNTGAAAERDLDGRHDRPGRDDRQLPGRADQPDHRRASPSPPRPAPPSSAPSTAPPSPPAARRRPTSGLAEGAHSFSRPRDRPRRQHRRRRRRRLDGRPDRADRDDRRGPAEPDERDRPRASPSPRADGGTTFECSLDGGAFAALHRPATYTGLAEGDAHLPGARDRRRPATPAPPGDRVDDRPDRPDDDDRLDARPTPTNQTSASFAFSAADAAQLRVQARRRRLRRLLEPEEPTAASPTARTPSASAAIDAVGNTGAAASATWTVDTAAPSLTIDCGAERPDERHRPPPRVHARPGTVDCRLDGAAWAACTSPATVSGLAAGPHTFDVEGRRTRPARRRPRRRGWTVDLTAPAASIDSGPGELVLERGRDFSFCADEPVTGFECSLDGGAFSACTSPQSYSGLADGATPSRSARRPTWPATPAARSTPPGRSTRLRRRRRSRPRRATRRTDRRELRLRRGRDRHRLPVPRRRAAPGARAPRRRPSPASPTAPTPSTSARSPTPPATRARSRARPGRSTPSSRSRRSTAGPTGNRRHRLGRRSPSCRPSRATLECSLDLGAFAPCTLAADTLTGLADGTHTFSVRGDRHRRQRRRPGLAGLDGRHDPAGDGFDSGPSALDNSTSASLTFSTERRRDDDLLARRRRLRRLHLPGHAQRPRRRQPHRLRPARPTSVGNAATVSRTWTVDTTPPPRLDRQRPVRPERHRLGDASRSPQRPAPRSSARSTAAAFAAVLLARRRSPASPTATTPSTSARPTSAGNTATALDRLDGRHQPPTLSFTSPAALIATATPVTVDAADTGTGRRRSRFRACSDASADCATGVERARHRRRGAVHGRLAAAGRRQPRCCGRSPPTVSAAPPARDRERHRRPDAADRLRHRPGPVPARPRDDRGRPRPTRRAASTASTSRSRPPARATGRPSAAAAAAPYSASLDTTALGDGQVDLRVFVTDVAGNAATIPLASTPLVDNTPPTAAMTAAAGLRHRHGHARLDAERRRLGHRHRGLRGQRRRRRRRGRRRRRPGTRRRSTARPLRAIVARQGGQPDDDRAGRDLRRPRAADDDRRRAGDVAAHRRHRPPDRDRHRVGRRPQRVLGRRRPVRHRPDRDDPGPVRPLVGRHPHDLLPLGRRRRQRRVGPDDAGDDRHDGARSPRSTTRARRCAPP